MTLTRAPGRASSGVMLLALPFHYFLLHKRVVVRSLLLAFQPLHVAIGKDMPARLATLILQLVDSEGVVSSESYRIPTRYTHEQLASMIVCKRVAVSRAFSRLKVAGTLSAHRAARILRGIRPRAAPQPAYPAGGWLRRPRSSAQVPYWPRRSSGL